ALVPLGRRARLERAEIAAATRPGILLARVQAVFARRQLADHDAATTTASGAAGTVRGWPTTPADIPGCGRSRAPRRGRRPARARGALRRYRARRRRR